MHTFLKNNKQYQLFAEVYIYSIKIFIISFVKHGRTDKNGKGYECLTGGYCFPNLPS